MSALSILVPIVLAFSLLAYFGWQRRERNKFRKGLDQEARQRSETLTGGIRLRAAHDVWRRSSGRGQFTMLVVGTFAANTLPALLQAFVRAGAESCVGTVLVAELDAASRSRCQRDVPDVFRSRLIWTDCPNYSIGMSGASVKTVLSQSEYWRSDVLNSTQEWLSRVDSETESGLLWVLLSSGGSAALGFPPSLAYHERFPRKPIYVSTILDQKSPVRERISEILELFSLDGLVRGFLLMDNRRFSWRTDGALALLLAASTSSNSTSDMPLDPANALAYIFPEESPGRFATLAAWGETLPVYHLPAWEKTFPEVYYSKASLFEEKATRGVNYVLAHPELQSVPFEPANHGQTKLVLVVAPVVPDDLRKSGRRVLDGLDASMHPLDPDLSIQFAGVGSELNPDSRDAPVVVIYLTPLAASLQDIDELARGNEINPKFLPPGHPLERLERKVALQEPSRNGRKVSENA